MAQGRFYIDGVVTVVDAKHIQRHLAGGLVSSLPEAERQLAYADVVLLNKSDLVEEDAMEQLDARVEELNPMAARIRCVRAQVELGRLLGIHAFTPSAKKVHSALVHTHARHTPNVSSVAFAVDGCMDVAALQQWLQEYVGRTGEDLYRVKGLLAVEDQDHKFVVQGVCAHIEGTSGRCCAARAC